jgi:hypothetical protein
VLNLDNESCWFQAVKDDPFLNHEVLCVAMITLMKEDLLESDFSMCLGLLMSYKEPADLIKVI